jgi:hypothetical protein
MEKNSLDLRPTWVTTSPRERIEFVSQGPPVLGSHVCCTPSWMFCVGGSAYYWHLVVKRGTTSKWDSCSNSCQLLLVNINNNLHSSKLRGNGVTNKTKSIIFSTVSMYRSQTLVVSCEKEAKGKFWSSWFKSCGMWQCFNWWKGTFSRGLFVSSSASNSGLITAFYFSKIGKLLFVSRH